MSLSAPAVISSNARGCTEVKLERFTYDWDIKEFRFLPQNHGECIYSPIFRTCNNGVEWKLCLFPRNDEKFHSDFASMYLCLHSHKSDTIKIERLYAEATFLPMGLKTILEATFERKDRCRFTISTKRSELCGSDAFTIHCEIQIPRETITEPIDTAQYISQALDTQEGRLIQDFRLFFKEPKFSDLAVIVGTHKFPVHRMVLAARSPVFAAMFEHKETQENLKNEIKIEKMEPEVVKAMLEFIYTDEASNMDELTYGLLEAADKYDLPRLRSMCEKNLCETLNTENAAAILIHADLHRSYKLKEYVIGFMDDLIDMVETEGYSEMREKYPALLDELICAIAAKRKPKKMNLDLVK